MNINIIIDIQNSTIKESIVSMLEHLLSSYQMITYQQICEPIVIFKEINNLEELKNYKNNHYPQHSVIFIIDHLELIFETLDQYPLCFIRKETLEKDLYQAIELIMRIYHCEEKVLTFKMGYSYIYIKSSQIIYIESLGHYLIIHTQTGTYQVREKLSTLKKNLSQNFIQIHKSYILNQEWILKRKSKEIILKNQIVLPVGRKYGKRGD